MTYRAIIIVAALTLAGCATQPQRPMPVAPTTAPTVMIPPGPPQGEPEGYVNLPAPQLRAAFGHPAFVRHDGLSEMWRYDGAACRGFFFLYGQEGHAVVKHVETLPRGNGTAVDPACLAALRTAAGKPAT